VNEWHHVINDESAIVCWIDDPLMIIDDVSSRAM